jgi:hypothetical protein
MADARDPHRLIATVLEAAAPLLRLVDECDGSIGDECNDRHYNDNTQAPSQNSTAGAAL